MKKIVTKCWFLIVFACAFCACDGVDELINVLNCKFEVQDVEEFTFAGIHFDRLDSLSEISDEDMATIEKAIEEKNALVMFTLNIVGTNPNDVAATVEKLLWKITLDGLDVAEGVVTEGFTIPPLDTNILSLKINTNATDIYEENTLENIFSFYQEIMGKKTSTVAIKIKPTINDTEFPEYITLEYVINNGK